MPILYSELKNKTNGRFIKFIKKLSVILLIAPLCFLFLFALSCVTAGGQTPGLDEGLPIDPAVKIGKLDNGLVYYIRKNTRPENRIALRLVVKAGSVNEDDDERGVAHFVEHMAFDGTVNFPRSEITNFLESIGMRFGPELNAYTSFDETVYMLEIPAEDNAIVEKGLRILVDWAHNITFSDDQVLKERGVITEEWRLGRGAQERMRDKQLPVILHGSRYGERQPIGKIEVIEKCDAALLKRFYNDWYRPEKMAVVAVGDFDKEWMEQTITRLFSDIKPKGKERKLDTSVPDHKDTLITIASDKEATSSNVILYIKHPVEKQAKVSDYRNGLVRNLYNGIINTRFSEYVRDPGSLIIEGYSGYYRYVQSADFYYLGAEIKEGKILDGLWTMLTEVERTKRFGVSSSELEREKKELFSRIESAYNEREKTESGSYVREYVSNFIDDEPMPGIENEYRYFKDYLPGITLEEVNKQASLLMTQENRVILVQCPDKKEANVPDEGRIDWILTVVSKYALDIANEDIEQSADTGPDKPLLSESLSKKDIVKEKKLDAIGVTELILSNGARVVLKPTDFKKDEILFTAFCLGGSSLAEDRLYIAAATAPDIIADSGIGDFSQTELEKKLAGLKVSIAPWNIEVLDAMRGSSSPSDVEALFKLIYLYFTSPRKDESAFLAYRERLKNDLANKSSNPEAVFWDTMESAINNDHPRSKPWTPATLDELDLEASYAFYKDRYGNASGFTFVFAGNFSTEEIKPLVQTYIGNLGSKDRKETFRDRGSYPPAKSMERVVKKGIAPKSRVQIVYCDKTDWSFEARYDLNALASVLDIELRDKVREEIGGTYDIAAYSELYHYPHGGYNLYIGFGCAPEQTDSLSSLVYQAAEKLRSEGPLDSNVAKVREILKRELETNIRQNSYWLANLQYSYIHGLDPQAIKDYERLPERVTKQSMINTAKKFLDPDHMVRVVLYPENFGN